MKIFQLVVAAVTLLSVLSGASAQSPESAIRASEEMTAGQVKLFLADRPLQNVLVGDSLIADVNIIDERRFAVTAKKAGLSSLMILYVDRANPTHTAFEVVPPEQYGRGSVQVRSFGKAAKDHSRKSYWCTLGSGCQPDAKNFEEKANGFESSAITVTEGPEGVSTSTTQRRTGSSTPR